MSLARGTALSQLGRHGKRFRLRPGGGGATRSRRSGWALRGNALLEQDKNEDALASYDRAVALKPDLAEAWRHRGHRARATGATGRSPRERRARAGSSGRRRGELERSRTSADAAEPPRRGGRAYDRVLTLRPDDVDALYNRANALSILKRYEEAMRDCERAARDRPGLSLRARRSCPLAASVLRLASPTTRTGARSRCALDAAKRVISPFNHKALSDSAAEQLQCALSGCATNAPASPIRSGAQRSTVTSGSGWPMCRRTSTPAPSPRSWRACSSITTGSVSRSPRYRSEATRRRRCGPGSRTRSSISSTRATMGESRHRFALAPDGSRHRGRSHGLYRRMPEQDLRVPAGAAPGEFSRLSGNDGRGLHGLHHCRSRCRSRTSREARTRRRSSICPIHICPATGRARSRNARRREPKPVCPKRASCSPRSTTPTNSRRRCSMSGCGCSREIEGSVLWLPDHHPSATRNLIREARSRGIDGARLVFAAPVPSPAGHLARLRLADLFLDTLPYNAHSTANDALWAGLPVLTCMVNSFAGRVAASLLGGGWAFPNSSTESLSSYEALALKLARDKEHLAAVKAKLERNRDSYPLFDTARFTRGIWRRPSRRCRSGSGTANGPRTSPFRASR